MEFQLLTKESERQWFQFTGYISIHFDLGFGISSSGKFRKVTLKGHREASYGVRFNLSMVLV